MEMLRVANQRSDAERRVPTIQEVMDLPPADSGVFMMTEKEVKGEIEESPACDLVSGRI